MRVHTRGFSFFHHPQKESEVISQPPPAQQYSAYQRTPDLEWVGVHRLPLESAIYHCKEYKRQQDCLVAVVPDGADPAPYFQIAEGLA